VAAGGWRLLAALDWRNCFRQGATACQVNFLTRIVIQNFVVNDFLNEEHR
jgi:hypothetical protein